LVGWPGSERRARESTSRIGVTVQSQNETVTPLPGLAPAAMQEGRYTARAIRERLRDRTPRPFRYRDKGNLATIGRSKAVADIKGIHLAGFPAWASTMSRAPRPRVMKLIVQRRTTSSRFWNPIR
jgi:NADH dehydrogenase FAD-containing subunit